MTKVQNHAGFGDNVGGNKVLNTISNHIANNGNTTNPLVRVARHLGLYIAGWFLVVNISLWIQNEFDTRLFFHLLNL